MTLTPQEIRDKQFTTVRMKTGYDMDEVDGFLDQVENEITRMVTDNDDLRARLAKCQSQVLGRPATDAPTKKDEDTAAQPVVKVDTPPAAAVVAPPAEPALPPAQQAFTIIEMAQKTADETVAKAKADADAMLAEARTKSAAMTADLDKQRKELEDQVAQLRTYERTYRARLREYIQGQLANLDNLKADSTVAPEGGPAVGGNGSAGGDVPDGPPIQA